MLRIQAERKQIAPSPTEVLTEGFQVVPVAAIA